MTIAVRDLVLDALDKSAGIRANPAFFRQLSNGEDLNLAALEIDSLSRFEAMMQIEDALGIELDDDEVTASETLGQLVALIEAKAGRAG